LASATVDKVVSEVVQETLANLAKSLEEAEAEALRVIERVEEELRRELTAVEEAGKAARESARQRILSTAEVQAKNMAIAAVEDELAKLFEDVKEKLRLIASDGSFKPVMKKLLDEAVQLIGRDMYVESNEAGLRMLREILSSNVYPVKVTVVDKPAQILGGLRAYSADGRMRFDNSLESRLERMKPALRTELAKMIMKKEM